MKSRFFWKFIRSDVLLKEYFFTFSQQNEFSTKISRNILSFQIHLLLSQYIQYQAPSTIDIIRKFTQRLNTFFPT